MSNLLWPNEENWDFKQIESIRSSLSQENFDFGWNFLVLDEFNNADIIKKSMETDIISVKAGFLFSDSFAQNKILEPKIKQLGYKPSKFKIFYQLRNWYKKLFKLNPELQKKYDFYMNKLKPDEKSKLVCAQVRMGDIAHVGQVDPDTPIRFWNFINQTFLQGVDPDLYKIFITADREHVKYEARNYFAKHQVIFQENSSFHVENNLNINSSKADCDLMGSVLLDFHILQNCDYAVISQSGFGILGMWNRIEPLKDVYVFTKKIKQN